MVEPVTVALLSGVGLLASSVSGWLASRAAKKRKQEAARRQTAPAKRPRPKDLPEITVEAFFQKWLGRVRDLFARPPPAPPAPPAHRPKTGTQRIVGILNLLEPVFIVCLVALLAWLVVEPLLLLVRPDWVRARPETLLFFMTAAAVGYGTNWIAIKMLFHPRRRNKVWTGIIPDRRDELTETISNSVIERLIGPEIIRKHLHESGIIRELIIEASRASRKLVDDRGFRQDAKALIYDAVEAFATSETTKETVAQTLEQKIKTWTGSDAGTRIAGLFKAAWGPILKREVLRSLPELPAALEHVFGRIDEKIASVPDWLDRNQGRIEKAIADWGSTILRRVDFKPIIVGQLRAMSPDSMEAMLAKPVSTELRFVQTSGGLFGLAVAAAIEWVPVRLALIALTLVLLLVYVWTVQPESSANPAPGPAPPGR